MDTATAVTLRAETGEPSIGEIIAISGSEATVLLDDPPEHDRRNAESCPHIGTVLTVDTGNTIVLCLITGMSVAESSLGTGRSLNRRLHVELVGELPREEDGYLRTFQRGVTVYPRLGDRVQPASRKALEKAYYFGNSDSVEIGRVHQDRSIPAVIKLDDMMGKHFAIVGSTGSGKSCTVALILRQVLTKHPNGHILLLDPHNEYGGCFGERAEVVGLDSLSVPFWFLTFDEISAILIGEVGGRAEEVEILRDLIPVAKRQYSSNRRESRLAHRSLGRNEKFSIDTPVPYRISDLVALLDKQMGRLEVQKDLSPYKRLKSHIESITHDPRYGFMFGNVTVQDNLAEVLKRLFRIPVAGKPITVLQLVGLPAEILNVVVSVLARLAFDLAMWSGGKMPITFVCEEAHRYVPRDAGLGFEPTKRAVSQIAKEGRKYGISLCIVSQRPGDIDPTILSQCSTVFAMRLTNERDQRIVKSAIADAAESLLDFLPSLGTRETVVFGEGVALPSRIALNEIPEEALPQGSTAAFAEAWSADISDDGFVEDVVERWRMAGRQSEEDAGPVPVSQPQADQRQAGQFGGTVGYAPEGIPATTSEGLTIEAVGPRAAPTHGHGAPMPPPDPNHALPPQSPQAAGHVPIGEPVDPRPSIRKERPVRSNMNFDQSVPPVQQNEDVPLRTVEGLAERMRKLTK